MQPMVINKNLISALTDNLNYPFLLLDRSGNIYFSNKEADELFNTGDITNIYDLFGSDSGVQLKRIMDSAFTAPGVKKTTDIVLRSGKELKLEISVKRFKDNNEFYLLISFQKHKVNLSKEGAAEVKLTTKEVKSLIKNDEILAVIKEIESLYPFTYIGKEKLRNLINRLAGIFWVRDGEGNLVLVNNNFAEALGLIPEAIEGKPEISFTPSYLIGFRSSIDQYLKNTIQWVSSRGFALHGINSFDTLIQIPLIDPDKHLTAVIGFSLGDEQETAAAEGEWDPAELVGMIPYPALITGNDGIIISGNKSFGMALSRKEDDYTNQPYNSVLPSEISQKISLFLNERNKETSFKYSGSFGESIISHYIIHTRKNTSGRKSFFIIFEKDNPEEDLERIINRRGIMFDVLIQSNPQPVFIYDKDNLRFLEVNDAALKLYGYRRDEFLKMDLTDLYTPEDIQTLLDSPADAASGAKFSGPYRHKRKDGSSVFVELSKTNFTFQDNAAHFNIVRDVTEKLQLLNQNQLFKAAFDNTQNLLFVTDASGFITFSNKAVQNMLGYSKKDLENTSFAALTTNEARAAINSSLFQATPRDTIVLDMDLKKLSGETVKTEVTATPVVNYKNEITSFTLVGRYETAGAGALTKEVIREVIKEVPVEVIKEVPVEVVREVFIETKASAGKPAADQKENLAFLSSLFHDILTPINVIMGFVQELTDSIEKPSAEQKESVDIINQNRVNLLNIMNSIVEYSSIEKDTIELNLQDIAVTEIIDSIQSEIEPVISPRGMEFGYGKISSSLKFKSDKQRMQNFILLLVKMVSSISREKKIYFSAYHWRDNEFYLSIKNNYNVSTKYLVENFELIFADSESLPAKDFGIPKLNMKLARALLRKLKGRFELIQKGDTYDYGFIFPVEYGAAQAPKTPLINISTKKVTPPVIEEPVDEIFLEEETPEKPDIIQQEPVKEAEKEISIDDLLSEEELELESDLSSFETELSSNKETPKPVASASEKLNLSQLSCLYIEDQVDSQILFKVQMKDLKDIKFAVSFEEALPLLDHSRFDFVLIDINLQGEYNGIDAMKVMKDMPAYKNVPLIAVTAYVLPGDRERFMATGFNDFISKPLFREKLVNSLERIFLLQE